MQFHRSTQRIGRHHLGFSLAPALNLCLFSPPCILLISISHSSSTKYIFLWYIMFLLLGTSSLLLLLLLCSFHLPSKCSWWKHWWPLTLSKNILFYLYRTFAKKGWLKSQKKTPTKLWRSWQNINRQKKRQNPCLLW